MYVTDLGDPFCLSPNVFSHLSHSLPFTLTLSRTHTLSLSLWSSFLFFLYTFAPTLSNVVVCFYYYLFIYFLATVVVLFLSWRAVVLAITPSPVIKNSMRTACGILKNVQWAYIMPCCYYPPPTITIVLRYG